LAEPTRTSKVIALSLGQAFATFASIIAGIVAARLLNKHDYATMKQTMLAYSFAAPLLMLGLPNAIYYFMPRSESRKKGILIDNLTLLLFMGLVFSTFLLLGGTKVLALRFNNPDLSRTLEWLIPYPLFVMPASVLGAVLLTQGKTTLLAKYNAISSGLMVVAVISGAILTRSYTGPLFAQIVFPLLLLPVVLWMCFRYIPGNFTLPNRNSMVEMLKYSTPLGLSTMLGVIMLESNKIVVSVMCTPEEFANYVNGAVEIPLVGILTATISSVILVDMTNYIHAGNKEAALELFKKAAVKSATVLIPAMFFLLFTGRSFIVTLYSEKYLESVIPFYIFLFFLPVRIVFYGTALMALGKPKVILFRSIFDLLINTVLSIVLVHFVGYIGAAIATLMTLYMWTVPFNLYKISQGFSVPVQKTMPFRKLGTVVLISCLPLPLLFVQFLLPFEFYIVRLFLTAVLYFPVVLALLIRQRLIVVPLPVLKYIPNWLSKILFI
jgi:O-antigen/teichoic acid export membrane protein